MLKRILTRKVRARSELGKVAAERRREALYRHGRVMEFVDKCIVRRGGVTLAEIEAWEQRHYPRATSAREIKNWLSGIGLVAAENLDRWVKEQENEEWLAAWV